MCVTGLEASLLAHVSANNMFRRDGIIFFIGYRKRKWTAVGI